MKQKNIIGIVDFQAGNITSLRNSISFLGYKSLLVKKPNDIKKFSKIILPGVGSFDTAMKNLKKNKIDQELRNYVKKKSNKLLGICLGMQLLFEKSEETNNDEKFVQGLSIIKGSVESFSTQRKKRFNIGWSEVQTKKNNDLFLGIVKSENFFYFVHGFYCKNNDKKATVSFTKFKNIKFCSSIQKNNNIFGVQFHPEKSLKSGLILLKNFCKH